jgi:protein TonB
LSEDSQPQLNNEVDESEVFTVVEEMPEFPGGMAKLAEYLANNIKYPQMARESGIQGRVFINFVVEPDGHVSNVNVKRSVGGGCDEEALRVVKAMPKWKPGKQRGKAVRVSYNLPVNFKLQ